MNQLPQTIQQLLNVQLNQHAYPVDTFNGKPMPYPANEANQSMLSECQQALDEAITQHPCRLMTSVLLYHPNGYQPLNPSLGHYPNARQLTQPTPNKQEPDMLITSFFERLNIQLEQLLISDRKKPVSAQPYHAITKRINAHYTVVVFLFNKSEYSSLGRNTGSDRYVITSLVNAWCSTVGIDSYYFDNSNPWIKISKALVVNASVPDSQTHINAMHHQLSWLAHRSLGDGPITYWGY
ncbi:MAG: inovirus-type Gp2 protein [Vibrio sp.]